MKAGRDSKYSVDLKDKLLAVASSGDLLMFSIPRFCADNCISERTYYNYVAYHEEFREAHERALANIKAFWLTYGAINLDNKDFCHKGWEKQIQTRFGDSRVYLPALTKAMSYSEKAEIIINECALGAISINSAKSLLDVIERAARLKEYESLADRVEMLENALLASNNDTIDNDVA